MHTRRQILLGAICAILFQLVDASSLMAQVNPVISEFKAVNTGPLKDENQQFNDWIEIYNPGASAVSLQGWSLTDTSANLAKWKFPAVTLDPYSFLIVFASGNDRTNPVAPLHANFKLDTAGEYLALVKPDGTNVVSQYSPRYPVQHAYASYGLGMVVSPRVVMASAASAGRVLAPTSDLGSTWTQLNFDDTSWTPGLAAVGYDMGTNYSQAILTDIGTQMSNTTASAYLRIPFSVADPLAFQELKLQMRYDDGFIAYLNGTEVARANAPTNAAWNSTAVGLHGSEPGVTAQTVADFDTVTNFFTPSQQNAAPAPAILTNNAGSTGNFLRLLNDGVNDQANSIAFDQPGAGTFPLITAEFDFRVASPGTDPADGFAFMLIPTSTYGTTGVGINPVGAVEKPNFAGVFGVGFGVYPHATRNGLSVHWNATEIFNVEVPTGVLDLVSSTFLHCRIALEYVEGGAKVAVYITPNGSTTPIIIMQNVFIAGMTQYPCRVQMAGRTGGLNMNVDLDNINVVFGYPKGMVPMEEFDISRHLGALQTGANILSIHGLNAAASSPDFLIMPELYARSITLQTNAQIYFDQPTPGVVNSSGNAAVVPAPAFSVASGVYTKDTLTVELTTTIPSAIIHYTLDGKMPNENSPIYGGAMTISNSALIAARAYAPNYLPSPPEYRCYTMVDRAALGFSSKLPVMIIDTLGQAIMQDMNPKASTIVTIIDAKPPGSQANLALLPDFQGLAGVEGRGQSSWGFGKRPLNVEFQDIYGGGQKVAFLDFPAGSDFALISQWDDKSFLNDLLAQELYEKMGHYAVRRRLVEVFYNGRMDGQGPDSSGRVGTNDHVGIYLLIEKIRIDNTRVNISTPESGDPGDPITGGYIWKKDKNSPGDVNIVTPHQPGDAGSSLKFHDPRPENLLPAQRAWLTNYLIEFESVLYGSNFRDPINGYAKYVDVNSFVDFHWMVEFPKQIDGYRLSSYFYKDRGAKIHWAPIWDWNLSFGNANYLEGGLTNGWYYPLISEQEHIWERRMMADPDYNQRIVDRWGELSSSTGPLNLTNLLARVDQLAANLTEAANRDDKRWPRMGTYLWPNPDGANLVANTIDGTTAIWDVNYATIGSFSLVIPEMKKYITGRYNWISRQYLKAPVFSRYSGTTSAPLSMSTTPANAIIYYTVDGSDPRLSGGFISPKASVYSGTVIPPANARICARTWLTNAWSPLVEAEFTHPAPALAITEIMFHPAAGLGYAASEFEYIELMNTTPNTLDLSGMKVAGGVDFTFPLGPLLMSGIETTNNFDVSGTAYTLSKLGQIPVASVASGGPAGSFMRLVSQNATNRNRLSFDQTAAGNYDKVTAEFDFRGQNISAPQVFGAPTIQDFDNSGAAYLLKSFDADLTTPIVMPAEAGSSGSFVRLTKTVGSENGGIYFDATAARAYNVVTINFDFRCAGAADGFGFAFLNTANYGVTGTEPSFSEDANMAGSIGLGFDIYLNAQSATEPNANHVSLHNNGVQVGTASPTLNLAAGKFHRAQTTIQFQGGQALVTVKISPDVNGAGGPTETLYNNVIVSSVSAYQGRVAFCGRTGGATANQDIDNINVQYSDSLPTAPGGLSMVMLPTSKYGVSGAGTTLANFTDAPASSNLFALNLDMHVDSSINDANLYWNGTQVGNSTIAQNLVSLDSGDFHHAKLELTRTLEGALATLSLTRDVLGDPGIPIVIFSNLLVTGFQPGADRIEFAGRSGGQNINVDLENVRVRFETNSANPLAPGQRLLLVKNRAAFESRYGAGLPIAGEFTGQLNNAGDHLAILGRYGEPILDFNYADAWQPLADGYGFSLVANNPNAAGDLWNSSSNWSLGSVLGGTPGQLDAAPPIIVPVVVNEVLSDAVLPLMDAIELFNASANPADISYWFLTDDLNNPYKYQFPPSSVIQPGGYRVIYESTFNSGALTSFGLKASGESVYLFSANAAGQLTGYQHGFNYGPSEPNSTLGRLVTSTGDEHLVAQTHPTLGSLNAGPKVGPVVISEIMYHPTDYAADVDNTVGEFIELRNITTEPVWLFDPLNPQNTWILRGAVDYVFPANTILPPGGSLLVVSFNPEADDVLMGAFYAQYGLGAAMPLYGPYQGKLDNSTANVELAKPTLPDPTSGNVNYILVDKVHYVDNSPWPLAADGEGFSLQRVNDSQYGNDPVNWLGAAPTPGSAKQNGAAPVITLQPVSQVVYAQTSVRFSVDATGAGPLRFQWRCNGSNLPDATNAVLTLPNVLTTQGGNYQAVVMGAGGSADSAAARLDVYQAATIVSQPGSGAVAVGGLTNLTINAIGNGPVTYQWRFQDANILGATNATLSLTNLQTTQAGDYTALISDGVATIASKTISLWVGKAPTNPPSPPSQLLTVGDALFLTGTPNGSPPLAFNWRKNGTENLMPFGGDDQTNLFIPNVTLNDGGLYQFGISNALRPAGGYSGYSTVLVVQPPKDKTTYVGGKVTLQANVNRLLNFRGQWQFAGTNITSQTTTNLVLNNVQASQAGVYTLLVTNSINTNLRASYTCTLTVLETATPPVITQHPTNALNWLGGTAQFTVAVTGAEPMYYQWLFNQTNLAYGSNSLLTVTNIGLAQVGGYQVVVSNAAGVVTSDVATLSLLAPPSIASQPSSTQTVAGTTVTLAAAASGTEPLSYQWWFGAQLMTGATNASLTIANINPQKAGNYQLVVSSPYGQAISEMAHVVLLTPPAVVLQPRSQNLVVGTNIQFYVVASGQGPLGYQWWFNQTNLLAGQTTSVLTLNNVQSAAAGTYTVVITNAVGATPSAAAMLSFGTPNPDSDNDGMPDDWERAHGLIVGFNDANLDPDGDGMSNLAEYLAGTDPHDPASVLKVEVIVMDGATPTMQFLAVSNRTYAVEYREQVTPGVWGVLTNILPQPATHRVTVTDQQPLLTNRFYRIVIP